MKMFTFAKPSRNNDHLQVTTKRWKIENWKLSYHDLCERERIVSLLAQKPLLVKIDCFWDSDEWQNNFLKWAGAVAVINCLFSFVSLKENIICPRKTNKSKCCLNQVIKYGRTRQFKRFFFWLKTSVETSRTGL